MTISVYAGKVESVKFGDEVTQCMMNVQEWNAEDGDVDFSESNLRFVLDELGFGDRFSHCAVRVPLDEFLPVAKAKLEELKWAESRTNQYIHKRLCDMVRVAEAGIPLGATHIVGA